MTTLPSLHLRYFTCPLNLILRCSTHLLSPYIYNTIYSVRVRVCHKWKYMYLFTYHYKGCLVIPNFPNINFLIQHTKFLSLFVHRSCSYFSSNTLPLKINFIGVDNAVVPAMFKASNFEIVKNNNTVNKIFNTSLERH